MVTVAYYTGITPGSRACFVCDENIGYELNTTTNGRTCQSDATWSEGPITCGMYVIYVAQTWSDFSSAATLHLRNWKSHYSNVGNWVMLFSIRMVNKIRQPRNVCKWHFNCNNFSYTSKLRMTVGLDHCHLDTLTNSCLDVGICWLKCIVSSRKSRNEDKMLKKSRDGMPNYKLFTYIKPYAPNCIYLHFYIIWFAYFLACLFYICKCA